MNMTKAELKTYLKGFAEAKGLLDEAGKAIARGDFRTAATRMAYAHGDVQYLKAVAETLDFDQRRKEDFNRWFDVVSKIAGMKCEGKVSTEPGPCDCAPCVASAAIRLEDKRKKGR